jgi:hypothetical protein
VFGKRVTPSLVPLMNFICDGRQCVIDNSRMKFAMFDIGTGLWARKEGDFDTFNHWQWNGIGGPDHLSTFWCTKVVHGWKKASKTYGCRVSVLTNKLPNVSSSFLPISQKPNKHSCHPNKSKAGTYSNRKIDTAGWPLKNR